MSTLALPRGQILMPTGQPRNVSAAIEETLDRYRPEHARPRKESVYLAPTTDFSGFGLDGGYIHEVEAFDPSLHDAAWLKDLQLAEMGQKYPEYAYRWRALAEGEVADRCSAYWFGEMTSTPSMEVLASSAVVVTRLSDSYVAVGATKGGWKP